jgi:hypothetical protein
LGALPQLKVLRPVISLITVDMMNALALAQMATKLLLHDIAMVKHPMRLPVSRHLRSLRAWRNLDDHVPIFLRYIGRLNGADRAFEIVVTRCAAELPGSTATSGR